MSQRFMRRNFSVLLPLLSLGGQILGTSTLVRAADPPAPTVPDDRPAPMPLWPQGAPGAQGTAPADIPTIRLFTPPAGTANGAVMVICPGGGYSHLSEIKEGSDIARWMNTLGVTGVVLQYRLGPRYHHPIEMEDAARAIRTVRSHASDWHIDPNRVGMMGFSAGGHLTSTLSTHFDAGQPGATDPIERQSSRPDLAVLVYPVITLSGPFAHGGSRTALLGPDPPDASVASLSNQTQVTSETPPTFLVHSSADTTVPVENSLMYATALHAAHVPFSLLIFDHGPHGFGLGGTDPALSTWPARCAEWLKGRGFLTMASQATPK